MGFNGNYFNLERLNMLVNNIMKVLSNLFGLNKKISANDIAVKSSDNKAKLLSECVIVDSGTNSNGSWVKYADGTMICHKRQIFSNTPIKNSWGNVVESAKLSLGDFPQPFVGSYPNFFIMPWQPFFVERAYSASLTSWGGFYAVRPGGSGTDGMDVTVSCFAIGRWKE